MGRLHLTMNPIGSDETIDLSSLPSGVYLMKVTNKTNNLVQVQNIVKQ